MEEVRPDAHEVKRNVPPLQACEIGMGLLGRVRNIAVSRADFLVSSLLYSVIVTEAPAALDKQTSGTSIGHMRLLAV